MRELKFRVWDKKKKCWAEIFIDKLFNISGRFIGLVGGPRCIFEQYTGLKDKNGKEIYEGDIAKFGEYPYKVTFDIGHFGIENENLPLLMRYHSFGGASVWDKKTDTLKVEVIGNIHENPELLDKEGE